MTALGAAVYILLLDLILGFVGWSVYAAGGVALLMVVYILAALYKRKYSVVTATPDGILILAYLFLSSAQRAYR